ncbi:MAG TPA: PepSY-like domain-containing protein [Cytophagaceae bacterium]|jgi:hypothetical protein|nr:PepSY-like domain-containing protein [Cytophagaceae bacterium]
MKKIFNTIAALIIPVIVTMEASAQDGVSTGPVPEEANLPGVVDKKHVPYVVTNNYYRDYNAALPDTWYVYPQYSDSDSSDWYVYSPSLVSGMPEYYIVHFDSSGTPHKIIYSKAGQKMTTYKGMNPNSNLPKAVQASLKKSAYKDWKITDGREEITRNSDKKKVYKITVEKGKEKRALYYQQDGKLLKDKKE